jgi:hypothetical protein
MTPRQHALRVAALEALGKAVEAEYAKARKAAEPVFRVVRTVDGHPQQAVTLPDGSEIGMISIKDGSESVTVAESTLMAWFREHNPEAIEEYVITSAWSDAEIIAMVKACFPGTVRERIRPANREALLKELIDSGGKLIDEETGDTLLAEIEHHRPTGSFAFNGRGAKERREQIMAAWQAGELAGIELGALALPAAGDEADDREPETGARE